MEMPRLPVRALALAALVALFAAPTQGATPLGGLAVAVTPDGKRLVCGGDSRALYELDPKTLEVKRRVGVPDAVVDLAFSSDGAVLLCETTYALHWVDGETLAVVRTVENVERMSVALAAGLVAVRAPRADAVKVFAIADGAERATVPLEPRTSIAGFGLSGDGKRLAVLYYRTQDPDEEKVAYKDLPKDLKDAALSEFKQRHDGYAAAYAVLDVATGKAVLEKKLWYSTPGGGNRLYWRGDVVYVVGYDNQNARIDAAGEVTYFELGNSYNYAIAASADTGLFLTGGLRSGSRTQASDLAGKPFRLDELPGFPEYFKGFTVAGDGTAWAGTSAWRVVRIAPDGTVAAAAAVH